VFEGEGDDFQTAKLRTHVYQNLCQGSRSKGSIPKSKGGAFLGISLQLSQDRLIRIEPRLRWATIRDAGQRPWRSQHRSSPSKGGGLGALVNLRFIMALAIHPCIFCRIKSITQWSLNRDRARANPDRAEDSRRKGKSRRRSPLRRRPQAGELSQQRSFVR
jgi:hypothetical protein